MLLERITGSIIAALYAVYNTLGYGLSERIYALVMRKELMARGHTVAMEVKGPVRYMGELLQYQRLDLLVDGQVIVEIKATPVLAPGAHNSCTATCDSRRMTSDYCCTSVRIPPSRA